MTQPVLGILTLYLNDQKQLEERPIYQRMITAGKKLGLHVFVFTPQDVNESQKRINGMFYNPASKQWSRRWTIFPEMVFDRCRLQSSYRFEQLKRFRVKHRHLHFLNRPLRNKWLVCQDLSEVPHIQPHLPTTKLYTSISDVRRMMKKEPLVYLKPINGTGGRGILRIEKLKSSQKTVYVQGRNINRQIIAPQRLSWLQLSLMMNSWSSKHRYLVQQGISLKLSNGKVHDYRMLVQKNGEGQWEVTGTAGRVGAFNSITSNLHGGGEAVQMSSLLRHWVGSDAKMQEVSLKAEQLGVHVAQFLESKYGALCELALDLAIDKSGGIWLLEVNPKPSREVFARIGDRETYRKAISRPMEYAKWYYQHHILKHPIKSESTSSLMLKSVDTDESEPSHNANPIVLNDQIIEELKEEMMPIQIITEKPTATPAPSPRKKRAKEGKPYYPSSIRKGTAANKKKTSSRKYLENRSPLYKEEDDTSYLEDLIRSYEAY